MQLLAIAPEDYVQDVLPQTYALWGAGRSYETYVTDFLAVAASRYGRRRKHTVGFFANGVVGATCKLYSRDLHWGERVLRSVGIGAVHTPEELRGRGYASAMLGSLLDAETGAGTDLAYLFSDIAPAFYERLGFVALPSRVITVRAASLPWKRIPTEALESNDWPRVKRCFEACDALRPFGFTRTSAVWEYVRKVWGAIPDRGVQPVHLVTRRGNSIRAYAFGRRVPASDAFVIDEFGFADEEAHEDAIALLRAAAGDLGRVSGWLPPVPARDLLPRGSVRPRRLAIYMVIALSAAARSWWKTEGPAILDSQADPIWSADHV